MINRLFRICLLLIIWPTIVSGAGFPEFGFCPLGGPPGWINRMTGWDRNYSPPVFQSTYPYAFQPRYMLPYNPSQNYQHSLPNLYGGYTAPGYSYSYGGPQPQ